MTEWEEPRLPEEQLKNIALGIFHGSVFTDLHIPGHSINLLPMIFMPLMFMDDKQRSDLAKHPPFILCADQKDALPRSINGFPCFTTMQMIYQADADEIMKMVEKLKSAAQEALKP